MDALAPLVFVNRADTKAGQIFTLAHELTHICLGESAVSDAEPVKRPTHQIENWCNQVAAQFLVAKKDLNDVVILKEPWRPEQLDRLARHFKVSTLVVLRRLYDTGTLTFDQYREAYAAERARVMTAIEARSGNGGGDFYNTLRSRVSSRFAHALVVSTLEGQTLYRDAFDMLGLKKVSTFENLARKLGVM